MDLVIAEKPSVAMQIAAVIGADKRKEGYVEGCGYYVTWCVGHLVELMYPAAYDEKYKKWDVTTLPILPDTWKYGISKNTKDQYDMVKKLMLAEDVTHVICATDAGREGELIFRNVYEKCGCKKEIRRLWISSMEDSAIREGFANLKPGAEYENLYRAALARERADWLFGMNLSRLYTLIFGGGEKLSIGRVMTPTLAMICDRDAAAAGFKKQEYYTVHLKKDGFDFSSEKMDQKNEAEQMRKACDGQTVTVTEVKRQEKKQEAPLLYDLNMLQQDANKLFGYTAAQTLDALQTLYEKKLTTYPRTDAKYLTDDMEDTLLAVAGHAAAYLSLGSFEPHDAKRLLNSKKVSDHHAVILTMQEADVSELSQICRDIYDLVAKRIILALGKPYRYISVSANADCAGFSFSMSGKEVTDSGFKALSDALIGKEKDEDMAMPEIRENMTFTAAASVVTGTTKPPAAFTEATLLAAMDKAGNKEMDADVERKGLGTSATRASIIEKLIKNGYVVREKKKLHATDAGKYLISVVPDRVKSVSLTCDMENDLLAVSKGSKEYADFMRETETYIRELVDDGKTVTPKPRAGREAVCACPVCGADVISGKFGMYCTGKCGCRFSFYKYDLTKAQCESLFRDKKEVLLKNLTSKAGKPYDIYITYSGFEKYETDAGKTGYNLKFETRFPEKKRKVKKV